MQVPVWEPSNKLWGIIFQDHKSLTLRRFWSQLLQLKIIFHLQVGRPIDEERQLLFEKLCTWLDEEVEHGVTSLTEIHKKMEELDPTEDKSLTYVRQYLKKKLQGRYEESLCFTSDERRGDIVWLKDTTKAILRDYRQQVIDPIQTTDDEALKEVIISTAIHLICGDLARVPLNSTPQ